MAETTSDSPHQRRCGREAAPTSKYADVFVVKIKKDVEVEKTNQFIPGAGVLDLQAYACKTEKPETAKRYKGNLLVGYSDKVAL